MKNKINLLLLLLTITGCGPHNRSYDGGIELNGQGMIAIPGFNGTNSEASCCTTATTKMATSLVEWNGTYSVFDRNDQIRLYVRPQVDISALTKAIENIGELDAMSGNEIQPDATFPISVELDISEANMNVIPPSGSYVTPENTKKYSANGTLTIVAFNKQVEKAVRKDHLSLYESQPAVPLIRFRIDCEISSQEYGPIHLQGEYSGQRVELISVFDPS